MTQQNDSTLKTDQWVYSPTVFTFSWTPSFNDQSEQPMSSEEHKLNAPSHLKTQKQPEFVADVERLVSGENTIHSPCRRLIASFPRASS